MVSRMFVLEFHRGLAPELELGVSERSNNEPLYLHELALEPVGVADMDREGVLSVSSRAAVNDLRGALLDPDAVGRLDKRRLFGTEDLAVEALD